MKLAFMTLGCPAWDLDAICRNGRKYGFDGVEFRGYLDVIDITTLDVFTTQGETTRKRLNDAGLKVSAISSSITVCAAERREANLEEAKRTIAVATTLGAERVRVFGGGDLATSSRAELARVGRGCIEEILRLDGAQNLSWLFETHDLWLNSADCRLLLDAFPTPFGALWDIDNSQREGGERMEQLCAAIGPRVGYVHVKDSLYDPTHPLAGKDGWRYVAPGAGQLLLKEALRLLRSCGYDGWLSFEHEKRWHPELPEPEEMFPLYIRWVREALKAG